MLTKADVDRFFSFVEKREDGCWVWTGATRDRLGYGVFSIFNGYQAAHRFSWQWHRGPIPSNMVVCHTCDNPPCCNPDHLFLGTVADNNRDCRDKGRMPPVRGERHGCAKLTEEKVRDIRTLRISRKEFSDLYGVSTSVISSVLNGRTWRHI